MVFKNSAIALSALLTSLGAQAQLSTTVYGVLDAGVRFSDGLGLSATSSPSANPGSVTALAGGVDRSGRFGLTGAEEFGSDYRAIYTLEGDLYLNTGSTNVNIGTDKNSVAATANRFFERQALVGLATPAGNIILGRQQSVIRDIIDGIDAIDGRFTSFNPNLQYTSLNSSGLVSSPATYYGTGDAGNGSMMRHDNAVKYVAQLGSFSGTLLYSMGGVAGAAQAGTSTEAGLAYKQGPVALAGAYELLNNSTGVLKLKAYTLGGRLTEGDWQVSANFGSNTADNTVAVQIKTDIYSVGTTYAASSAVDLTVGYYNLKRSWTNDVKPNATIDRIIGFAEYKFSRNTLVYLELDYNKWGGDVTQFQDAAVNKSTSIGLAVGLNHKI